MRGRRLRLPPMEVHVRRDWRGEAVDARVEPAGAWEAMPDEMREHVAEMVALRRAAQVLSPPAAEADAAWRSTTACARRPPGRCVRRSRRVRGGE